MVNDEQIKNALDEFVTLNESAAHTIQKMIDLLKEKKFCVYKQTLALKRTRRAFEKNLKNEIRAAWYEAKRWGAKAKSYKLTSDDYAKSDPPTP